MPVDGLWVDDLLYYGGSPETAHVPMVRADPDVTIHLPDPWKVVVVEGVVRVSTPSPDLAQRLADLANAKYAEDGFQHDATSYSEPAVLHPRRAIAWSLFPKNATRFIFPRLTSAEVFRLTWVRRRRWPAGAGSVQDAISVVNSSTWIVPLSWSA